MARAPDDLPVVLSLLDRLIDTDPKTSTEAPLRPSVSKRQFKEGLRRDLEWLLNTRRIAEEPDESMKELNRSVYIYGIPDFSTYSLASPKDQARILRSIQNAVKLFEPRLANVRLLALEAASSGIQALRLRIEGVLMMDPTPEHVSFDTVIELKNGACRVKGEADAG